MKYFSDDHLYINAECENCGRVLKIPRDRCSGVSARLTVSPPVMCQCGVASDNINGVPTIHDNQAVAGKAKIASNLIFQPSQLNSTSQLAIFVWKPPARTYYIKSATITHADSTLARENWWQQVRSTVMNELQPYLAQGWQLVTALGSDCLECKTYKESTTYDWSATTWIVWFVTLIVFALIPIIFILGNNEVYELVAVRVQLQRPRK